MSPSSRLALLPTRYKAVIARAGERIFNLQASDWRTPRSFADRIVPGDGDIWLGCLMRATHDAGYRAPCVVEIFSSDVIDTLYDDDLAGVVTKGRTGLNTAWMSSPHLVQRSERWLFS